MPVCIKRLQRAAIAANNTAGADEIELLTVLTTWMSITSSFPRSRRYLTKTISGRPDAVWDDANSKLCHKHCAPDSKVICR